MEFKITIFAKQDNEKLARLGDMLAEAGFVVDTNSDLAGAIVKMVDNRPDMLILDRSDFCNMAIERDVFGVGSHFAVQCVIVAGENGLYAGEIAHLPSNYCCLNYEGLFQYICGVRDMAHMRFGGVEFVCDPEELAKTAQLALLDLGFSLCSNGTRFIRDCILSVFASDCCPQVMYKTIYAEIANRYNKTLDNVTRCTRSAISSAWKNRRKIKTVSLSGVCFDDFALCPTAKEFIYYVANKLKDYFETRAEKESHVQSEDEE